MQSTASDDIHVNENIQTLSTSYPSVMKKWG